MSKRIEFKCNLSEATTPLLHVWSHTIGSGHALLALRADWQAQLKRCHDELGVRYVRFHGLLNDDMGTLITHAERPLYSYFNADQIWDFLLSINMKPFVELSFMPTALARGGETVFHYRGNITPPRDFKEWGTLMHKLAAHWVNRYGLDEVSQWFFEVWNEPNLQVFWTGTRDEYFELYRHTVESIKSVDSRLRVGGPSTAANAWVEEFLEFCEKNNLPADFVSTHHYPTDAFGKEGDDTETQLSLSRRSVLREQARDVRRCARGLPIYYTEWAASSNPRDHLHDEPYAAPFVIKTNLEMNGLIDGYSIWTFSDIFEETYFPSVPFHGGFGLLNIHSIPKPMYRAYQLLHRLGTEQLPIEGSHETVDAWIVRGEKKITVLLTNHALPRHPIQTEHVRVSLSAGSEPRFATIERIDEDHANPVRLWRAMGEPEYLSHLNVERLQAASSLVTEPFMWRYKAESMTINLDIDVPPHGVAAITLEYDTPESNQVALA